MIVCLLMWLIVRVFDLSLKISIWKYVKLNAGWRYCAAVEENNRYKPDWVHVNSHTEYHPEGNSHRVSVP